MKDVVWFLIYVNEKVAEELFDGNQAMAYRKLKESGYLKYLKEHTDVLHTESTSNLIDDAKRWLKVS